MSDRLRSILESRWLGVFNGAVLILLGLLRFDGGWRWPFLVVGALLIVQSLVLVRAGRDGRPPGRRR